MLTCHDLSVITRFCGAEPVRYRYLLQCVQASYSELDRAADALLGLDGPSRAYCDRSVDPALVALLKGASLQIEGQALWGSEADLAAWCRDLSPSTISTTHVALRDRVSKVLAIAPGQWRMSGEYTVTEDDLSPRITRPVRRLGPKDEPQWRRFQAQHSEELTTWTDPGASTHAFTLMAAGHPVDIYVTESEPEITGMLIVRPLTAACDEVWAMFVDQEHRRRGNAHSMLSEATHDILGRGRVPGYSAIGDREELVSMLRPLGFLRIGYRWTAHLD